MLTIVTSLHVVAHDDHVQIVKLLLNREASTNTIDLKSSTTLHFAIVANHIAMIKLLLNFEFNIHVVNNYLDIACLDVVRMSQLNFFRVLIVKKANFQIQNKYDMITLQYALNFKFVDILFSFVLISNVQNLCRENYQENTFFVSTFKYEI